MTENMEFPIRINRYLELLGVATRKGADHLIEAGLVLINKRRAILGQKINQDDQVEVLSAKRKLPSAELVYLAFYKPRGLVTHSPRAGERGIDLAKKYPGIFPLGRLDKDSEGLILMTNDGRVTERLLHPRFQHEKEYLVTVRENIVPAMKKTLETGVKSQGQKLTAKTVEIIDKHTLDIILTSGQKHQIRRMLAGAHLTVESLKRIRIMDITLGRLKPGQSRFLLSKEKADFLKALGL